MDCYPGKRTLLPAVSSGPFSDALSISDYGPYMMDGQWNGETMTGTGHELLNLLITKRNLPYIRNQSVPRCKHFPPAIKTNQVMMYKAKAAGCSEIPTKHSTQSEHHVEFFNIKPGGT